MTTNLLILTPEVPDKAIKATTSDTWGDSNRLNELNNNRCGAKGNLAKLASTKTGRTVISYDMGANGSQSVDHIAISRADLLQSGSVGALVVRGSDASYFAPSDISGCVAWWDPSYGVTVDANGGVSAWVDRVGAMSASQATSGFRPVLSRYDTKENLCYNSAPAASGDVASGLVSNVTFAAVTSSDWGNLFSNAAVFGDNSTTRITYFNRMVYASKTYTFSVYVRMDDGSAPSFSGSADFSLVLNGSSTTSGITTTSLGGGLYRISKSFTGGGSASNQGILKTASNTSKSFKVQGYMLTSTSWTEYVATTTGPVIAGINGNRAIYFDGTDDALRMDSLAATFSGADKANSVFVVVKAENAAATSAIFSVGSSASATQFFRMRYDTSNIRWNVTDDAALAKNNSSGGATSTSTLVLSHIDSGTAANDYKDGTLFGSASYDLDVGTKTLNVASIGARFNVATYNNFLGGYIAEVIVYSRALTSTERQSVEAYLTAKYQATPLVADYALAPNVGEGTRDYLSTLTASSSYRYFWVEMESSAASAFIHSKLYLGAALDLGDSVDSIECVRSDGTSDDFEAASGAIDVARGKSYPYRVRVTFTGITDALLESFISKVVNKSELRPGVFLATTANHEVLDGAKLLYCQLTRWSSRREKGDYHTIVAEFEEMT